jgi:hypothetical protein
MKREPVDFHVHGPSVSDFGESFNVAPQTFQPVIRLNRDTGEREIVLMRWGLIPYWILLANPGGAAEVSAPLGGASRRERVAGLLTLHSGARHEQSRE